MPVTPTPTWSAPQAGLVGDAAAVAGSAQINQMLGTHASGLVYQGNSILTPNGTGGVAWAYQLSTQDMDQPFTMSGTTIGRVQVPLLAVGDGADLLVSLCQDNAGTPGTVISQTRIPASWIYQFAGVSGTSAPETEIPAVGLTGNPLAVSQFNGLHAGPFTSAGWPYPSSGSGGPSTGPCSTCFGNHFIQMGGASGSTYYANVYTIAFDTAGNLSQAVPQPSLPVATDGTASAVVATDTQGNSTIVFMGGQTAPGVYSNAVYTASFDTVAGTVSAWTTQTNLPAVNNLFGAAAYGQYVYTVGGSNPGKSSVYVATVSNGQLGGWVSTTPLPAAEGFNYAVAVNGFLYVFGGFITGNLSTSYYAPINADGTLGQWITGPSNLPVAASLFNGNCVPPLGTWGILANGNGSLMLLSATSSGPDVAWQGANFDSGGNYYAVGPVGDGQWIYYGLYPSSYSTLSVYLTPRISVPLPATGLTNGATYHILLQQQGGDLNNYLRMHADRNIFPGNPTALTSPSGGYVWTPRATGFGVPIQVFDQTAGGKLWHTWEDAGARVTTPVYATTPDQRFLGLAEAARIQVQRNANAGFETGVAPWTVTGGALAQSTTQVYEGQYAAQVTPNGVATQVSITSEQTLPCLPEQSITVNGQFWFTGAVTAANFSLSIAWYTQTGTYLSSSVDYTTMPGATWTPVSNPFTAPAGAYLYAIVPALQGTPAVSQVWYADQVYSTDLVTPQQSTVTQINYPATWPTSATWPASGTTVLA